MENITSKTNNHGERENIIESIIKAYQNRGYKYETLSGMKKLAENLKLDIANQYATSVKKIIADNLTLKNFDMYCEFLDNFMLCQKDIIDIFNLTITKFNDFKANEKLQLFKTKKYNVFTFNFYKISDVVRLYDTGKFDKYVKAKKVIDSLDENNENLAQALYIINKSAKKSRDTKYKTYGERNYGSCSTAKTRAQNLYHLKDAAINKLISENRINYKGIHKQKDNEDMCFSLYELSGFTFHIPTKEYNQDELLSGELPEKIDSEAKIKVCIKFNQAINLLENYTGLKASGNFTNARERYYF